MSDSLLSISAAFGGSYGEIYGVEGSIPGVVNPQLQSGQGYGSQQ